MHYVNLSDGYQMPVHIIGRGKPVIILHGFGMDARLWLPFVLPYSHKFKFYLPHLRGFGLANDIHINQIDALKNYVEDLEQMIEQFKIESFMLAGISMGALTSLKWQQSGKSWKNVERYLHIDQSPAPYNSTDWKYGLFGDAQDKVFTQFKNLVTTLTPYKHLEFQQLPVIPRTQMRELLGLFFGHALSKNSHKKTANILFKNDKVLSRILPMTGWWNYVACMQSYLECPYDFRESLKNCYTPITVFTGLRSTMYPPQGQLLIQEMAHNVQCVGFDTSGHMPLVDQPLKFTRELGRFLSA